MRDCPNLKIPDKGSVQAQVSGPCDAPKKNRFYSLRSRVEQETSPDVVTGVLKFSILMYMPYLIPMLLDNLLHL